MRLHYVHQSKITCLLSYTVCFLFCSTWSLIWINMIMKTQAVNGKNEPRPGQCDITLPASFCHEASFILSRSAGMKHLCQIPVHIPNRPLSTHTHTHTTSLSMVLFSRWCCSTGSSSSCSCCIYTWFFLPLGHQPASVNNHESSVLHEISLLSHIRHYYQIVIFLPPLFPSQGYFWQCCASVLLPSRRDTGQIVWYGRGEEESRGTLWGGVKYFHT